jgi:hypothetical protein
MGGKLRDEIQMDCLSTEFERPATPGKGWGSSTWLLPVQTKADADDGSLEAVPPS